MSAETTPNLELTDSNKALLFLYLMSGNPLPERWGPTLVDRQYAALAFLCFEGDVERAKVALVTNEILGYAGQNPQGGQQEP